MFDFLDKIREKPESVRRMILYATTGTLSFLVVLVWFSTLSASFERHEKQAEIAYEELSPVEMMGSAVSSIWNDTSEDMKQVKEAFPIPENQTSEQKMVSTSTEPMATTSISSSSSRYFPAVETATNTVTTATNTEKES